MSRVLSAHQPAYHPWAGLIHKYMSCDVFVCLDNVAHSKGSFENRNQILTKNGPIWLTVPVHDAPTLAEVEVDNCDRRWARKHLHSIKMNYQRAKFWEAYEPIVTGFYYRKFEQLTDVTEPLTRFLTQEFDAQPETHRASNLKPEGTGWEMLLDLCKKLNCDTFLFGSQGRNYMTKEANAAFSKAGVKPLYQTYVAQEYRQVYPGFAPNLSSLDILLNLGGYEGAEVILRGGRFEE